MSHDPPLLFDLYADIGEQNNIAAEHPDIIRQLLRERAAILDR